MPKIEAPQANFQEQVLRIKEQSTQRDELLEGGWYTEEALEKECKFSKMLGIRNVFLLSCIPFFCNIFNKHV